jgi:hypothetical protein
VPPSLGLGWGSWGTNRSSRPRRSFLSQGLFPGFFLSARARRLKNPFNLNLLRGGDQRRQGQSGGEKFRFLVISAGFARLKTRLLPTKCRSTLRHRAPAASALPLVLSRVHWVRLELVAEVKYLTWTDDNFASAGRLRGSA